ncbi:MAG: hypothetical protein ACFE8T_10640, partial [Promethearchaeota archaeon]
GLKILLEKGYTFEDIKIEFHNEKIYIELIKPRYFIVMDLGKKRIQYYFSEQIGKKDLRLISKEDLLNKIKDLYFRFQLF